MIDWLKEQWCDWFHGGGHIKRDCYGRINWQCDRCGRWGEPVERNDEDRIIDSVIAIEERARGYTRTNTDEKYNQLLMAVGKKYPGETRHETALRYIRQAEIGEPNSARAIVHEMRND